MKYSEFTDDMRQEMKDAIKAKLSKLGISANVEVSALTNRYGGEYVYIKTAEFNTTPVIYKTVYVDGSGCILPVEEHDNVFELRITFGYRFIYFNGGTNGVSIGTIIFRIFEKSQWCTCLGLTI